METANIFNIQHFSVHDGPGVRTVIFFKGCNLRCRWCHNPESWMGSREIMMYPERCIGCMACREICPVGAHHFEEGNHWIEQEKCIRCFACCSECYADALITVGEKREIDQIFREIKRNQAYSEQSGGGVTFSGGECMLQPEALRGLLRKCKEAGIHTAVDTAGDVPWESFEQVHPYTDLFLYDLKAMDAQVHKNCTGVTNERILDNFKRLARMKKEIIVRIPWIPEYNGDQLEKIAGFLADYPQIRAELLPYHSMGKSKRDALGREDSFTATVPSKELTAKMKEKYHFY